MESKALRIINNCKELSSQVEKDYDSFIEDCSKVLFKSGEIRWKDISESKDEEVHTINFQYYLIKYCGVWSLWEYIKPDSEAIPAPNLPDKLV